MYLLLWIAEHLSVENTSVDCRALVCALACQCVLPLMLPVACRCWITESGGVSECFSGCVAANWGTDIHAERVWNCLLSSIASSYGVDTHTKVSITFCIHNCLSFFGLHFCWFGWCGRLDSHTGLYITSTIWWSISGSWLTIKWFAICCSKPEVFAALLNKAEAAGWSEKPSKRSGDSPLEGRCWWTVGSSLRSQRMEILELAGVNYIGLILWPDLTW